MFSRYFCSAQFIIKYNASEQRFVGICNRRVSLTPNMTIEYFITCVISCGSTSIFVSLVSEAPWNVLNVQKYVWFVISILPIDA